MDDRAIGLIGLMRRAGAIEIGEDNSGTAVSAGKAKLLLTAADVSENALPPSSKPDNASHEALRN